MPMNVTWEGPQAQGTRSSEDGENLLAWLNQNTTHDVDTGPVNFTIAIVRQVRDDQR
jgi:hypothetical protein